NVGGEQSGHIVLSDFATTGDGLIAGLQVLAVLQSTNKPVSEACNLFDPVPQLLKNVRFKSGAPLECANVQDAIKEGEGRLGESGRIV
ncbi:MAG TPA: phosphoglucosamine mutase, partial [Rhodobiaceae bacterium]|nr:phosphoglucosamine mutase [Rhodobiaceae bacterium]